MTVTPALGLLLSRRRRCGGSRRSPRGIQRVYDRSLRAGRAHADPGASSPWASLVIGGGLRRAPTFDEVAAARRSRTPTSWSSGTAPHGTSLPEMDRITSAGRRRAPRPPGREGRRRPGGPGQSSATRRSARTRPRCGSASTRRPTTARRSSAVKDVVAGYPGLPPRGDHLLEGPDEPSVLSPTKDEITVRVFGNDDLDDAAPEGRGGPEDAVAGTDGVVERARRVAADRADHGGRGRPGQGQGGRHQARRRPPGRGHAALGPPGRQPVRGPEGLRRRGVEHAGDPARASRASRTC